MPKKLITGNVKETFQSFPSTVIFLGVMKEDDFKSNLQLKYWDGKHKEWDVLGKHSLEYAIFLLK